MSTQHRRQRDFLRREQLILEAGATQLVEHGYPGLSMDRIAEEVEYSKGTLYQHFSSKEDLLAGMVLQTMDQRTRLLDKAATYPGRPRERFVAVVEAEYVFYSLHPAQVRATQLVRISSILKKANAEKRAALRASESRCVGILNGVIRDALANGDLKLPKEGRVEQVTFGLVSMVFGFRALLLSDIDLAHAGVPDPEGMAWSNIQALLDGYGWQPLSTEHNYEQTRIAARQMVIPELPAGAQKKLSMDIKWAAPVVDLPQARPSGPTNKK